MNTKMFRAVIHRFRFFGPIEITIKGKQITICSKADKKPYKLVQGQINDVLLLLRIIGFSTAERRSLREFIERIKRDSGAAGQKGGKDIHLVVHKHDPPQCVKGNFFKKDKHNPACIPLGAVRNQDCTLDEAEGKYKCTDTK